MILKLAWRNLWRNKRRTGITLAMMCFAVFLTALMTSIRTGMVEGLVNNVISSKIGHAQIHTVSFWEEQSIDNVFEPKVIQKQLEAEGDIAAYAFRIESGALCVSDEFTEGVLLFGIDLQKEKEVSALGEVLTEAQLLALSQGKILLGNRLDKKLLVSKGDSLSLTGQGYHGSFAMGNFEVGGIADFKNLELNKRLVLVSLSTAQTFFGLTDQVTGVIISMKDVEAIDNVVSQLNGDLDKEYEVRSWKKILPDMEQMLTLNDVGNTIVAFILYFIISFGFFGTIVMMMAERKHEMGVMLAVGMKKTKLTLLIILESLISALGGCLIGIVIAAPVIYWLYLNPIPLMDEMAKMMEDYNFIPMIYTSFSWKILFSQTLIVMFINALMSIYPMVKVYKMKVVTAMNS